MAEQHTPGPWEYNACSHGFFVSAPKYRTSRQRMYVADVSLMSANGEECEANARLIAAAPELLSALKGLTQIGTTPNGGIIVGPRGWEVAQRCLT